MMHQDFLLQLQYIGLLGLRIRYWIIIIVVIVVLLILAGFARNRAV